MKKIGIFYGSTTGATLTVVEEIANALKVNPADIHDVALTPPSAVDDYDVVILGASTWGDGDLQADMADFIDGLSALDLEDKLVAIFGCGDDTMADTFCDSVGEIYHRLHDTKAMFFAPFNNDDYTYRHSDSDVSGISVGLCIDNVNHADATSSRVKAWTAEILKVINDIEDA